MQPRELVARVRRIEIRTARLVDSRLAGQYHAVFKGRGVAFTEVRPYVPGDDVRAIDWSVTARMRAPHVKLFAEERDLTVFLLIDVSASGWFGSAQRSKREVATELAALLAFSAIKNNDQVGLLLVTDQVERFVPARKGKKHVLRVIRDILGHRPRSPGTDLRVGLEHLIKVVKRRAVVFVFSDFAGAGWERPLRAAGRRNDVVPVVVTDVMEEALPDVGLVAFEDLESGEVFELDTSGPGARMFAARMAEERRRREAWLRRSRMDFIDVRTDQPYVDALRQFFRKRAQRVLRARGGGRRTGRTRR